MRFNLPATPQAVQRFCSRLCRLGDSVAVQTTNNPVNGARAPDVLARHNGALAWYEVRSYAKPVPNRTHEVLVHGIEATRQTELEAIEATTGHPVWLAVYEVESGEDIMARATQAGSLSCICSDCRDWHPERCRYGAQVYYPRDSFYFLALPAQKLVSVRGESDEEIIARMFEKD